MESGNTVLATSTQTGTDAYTMTETGSHAAGSYLETVTGSESYTLTGTASSGTGVSATTINGSGTYALTDSGAGATKTSGAGTYSYETMETEDAVSGTLSQSQTGTTRYGLLEYFNNVGNTASGKTPGNMNFSPVGRPFVDPLIFEDAKSAAAFQKTMENDYGAEVADVVALGSGRFAVLEHSADRKALFAYADKKWDMVFDKKTYENNRTQWTQAAEERNKFIFASGAAGNDLAQKVYMDPLNPGKEITLTAAEQKELNARTKFLSYYGGENPFRLDIGGEGRYKQSKDQPDVLNVNIQPFGTGGTQRGPIPFFVYADATKKLPFLDKSIDGIYMESAAGLFLNQGLYKEIARVLSEKPSAPFEKGAQLSLFGPKEGMEKFVIPEVQRAYPNANIQLAGDDLKLGVEGLRVLVNLRPK